jgi:hypothetical protein
MDEKRGDGYVDLSLSNGADQDDLNTITLSYTLRELPRGFAETSMTDCS